MILLKAMAFPFLAHCLSRIRLREVDKRSHEVAKTVKIYPQANITKFTNKRNNTINKNLVSLTMNHYKPHQRQENEMIQIFPQIATTQPIQIILFQLIQN